MIYPVVPFPVTLNDPWPRFQGHGAIIDALKVLCAQLTHDLFAIAKVLVRNNKHPSSYLNFQHWWVGVPQGVESQPATWRHGCWWCLVDKHGCDLPRVQSAAGWSCPRLISQYGLYNVGGHVCLRLKIQTEFRSKSRLYLVMAIWSKTELKT